MLLNKIIRSSFTLSFLLFLPTWSSEEINQPAENSQTHMTRKVGEYFEEKRRLLKIISGESPSGERVTPEERKFASEKLDNLVYPPDVRHPTVDIDERVLEIQKKIDAALNPMREQTNNFLESVSPWTQTLNHHIESGSLTQEVLEQIKEDAKEKGFTLILSDFEKIIQNQELERKKIKLAKENFTNSLRERLVKHFEDGTLTQQNLDKLREEGKNLGIDVVIQGLPAHLH